MKTNKKLTAVDLFCGGGGLTIGLKRAGFNVVAGVEVNEEICKTYKANDRGVALFEQDIRKIKGSDILHATGLKKIDLVAGCPPCQGFSQLTAKYKREDERNDLVLEMARIIEELKPKMVMMENVPGLAKKGRPLLDKFIKRIEKLGYIVNWDVLQMVEYGVPQWRQRFVLLAGKGFEIPLPKPIHSSSDIKKNGLKSWVTVRDALEKVGEPVTFNYAKSNGGPKKFNWNVVRDLSPINIERLKFLSEGGSRFDLPMKLRPNCHKNNKGFSNVYARMSWQQPSPTITGGCVTLSSGRFGHPTSLRTISIREAARIQTFPDSYSIETENIATAADIIGNALPCKFAHIVSRACVKAYHN